MVSLWITDNSDVKNKNKNRIRLYLHQHLDLFQRKYKFTKCPEATAKFLSKNLNILLCFHSSIRGHEIVFFFSSTEQVQAATSVKVTLITAHERSAEHDHFPPVKETRVTRQSHREMSLF